jgi:hypothetical protein
MEASIQEGEEGAANLLSTKDEDIIFWYRVRSRMLNILNGLSRSIHFRETGHHET